MNRSIRYTVTTAGLGLAGVAGAVGIALAGPGVALAGPTPDPSPSSTVEPRADRETRWAQHQEELAGGLAEELGIDKARVLEALKEVQAGWQADARASRIVDLRTRLDAAVAEGRLTRDQADAIRKAAEAGVLPGGGGPGWAGHGPGWAGYGPNWAGYGRNGGGHR